MAVRKMGWKRYRKYMENEDVDVLRQYVVEVHAALVNSHKAHEKFVKGKMTGVSEDEAQEIANWYAEDDMKLGDVFPSICSASTFVAIYSFLEQQLMELCDHLRRRERYTIGVEDLAGQDYIDKAASYLEKICGIQEPKKAMEWVEIKQLQRVRNIIVHKRGKVREAKGNDDPDLALKQYVQSKKTITIDGVRTLVLSKDFCLAAVDTVGSFLLGLLDKVPDEEASNERPR